MRHAAEICVVTNQWVNSYKRLVSKNESPSHISWSNYPNNFNSITIPKIRKGSEDSSRIEFRLPDPGCNPYLTFASIITAGLNGMKNKYKLEKPTLNEEDLKNEHILPSNLGITLEQSKNNAFLKDVLSEEVLEIYLKGKETEWNAYSRFITEFELNNWLNL